MDNNIKHDENLDVKNMYNQFMGNNVEEPSQDKTNEFTDDGGIVDNTKTRVMPADLEDKLSTKFKELNLSIASIEDQEVAKKVAELKQLQEAKRQDLELDAHPAVAAVKAAFKDKDVTPDGKVIDTKFKNDALDVKHIEKEPQEEYVEKTYKELSPTIEVKETPENESIVQINVPAGETEKFIAQMGKKDQAKIQTAKTIVVTEVKEVKIPTSTKKITNLNQYKKLTESGLTEEIVPVPLPNSRFIAYVKGCGSLALATLMGDMNNHLDYIKRIEFCFKQVTRTSIGQLSFDEFTKRISPDDVDLLIHGILKASNPDNEEIQLTCGNPKCGKQFNFKYSVASLINLTESHSDLLEIVKHVTIAAKTVTDANTYHDTSPIRNIKTIELPGSGHIVEIVNPTVYTLIDKLTSRKEIEEEYNVITAIICMIIGRLFMKDKSSEDGYFEIDDPNVLASIIYGLDNEDIAVIREVASNMENIGQIAFSINNVDCPHCGYHQDMVPVNMDEMVFMKLRMSQLI